MKISINEQGLDEDEQRMGDLWSMSDAENEAFAKRFTLMFVLFFGLVAAVFSLESLRKYSNETPSRTVYTIPAGNV